MLLFLSIYRCVGTDDTESCAVIDVAIVFWSRLFWRKNSVLLYFWLLEEMGFHFDFKVAVSIGNPVGDIVSKQIGDSGFAFNRSAGRPEPI